MKRNAQAALLALTAFAVLPAKSTPSASLALARASVGIDDDAPPTRGNVVRLNSLDGEDIVKFGKTDDLPGLVTASFAPGEIRSSALQDRSLRGFEPDPQEGGQADPAPSNASPHQEASLGSTDAATQGAIAPIVPRPAPPSSESAAGADSSESSVTPPAVTDARENAPKPRLTFIGLIKPEHIVREQRCLAEAVYFEARSEPEEGRAAVAQVVLNRVKSGVYPGSVCGVVYQNRHRRLACQFTFACEGKALRITETRSWEVAVRIARDVYEGRIYLAEVGVATHYHADYVQPTWAKKLKKMDVIGRHIFYS